jgi:hypothetical protein
MPLRLKIAGASTNGMPMIPLDTLLLTGPPTGGPPVLLPEYAAKHLPNLGSSCCCGGAAAAVSAAPWPSSSGPFV